MDSQRSIDNAINEITSLNRKGIHKDDFAKIENISESLKNLRVIIEDSIYRNWESFITDSKAIQHDINIYHGKKVMNSYFHGSLPFQNLKSRKDIPDAFIYEAILSIYEEYGDVYFICADNNLRNSVGKNAGCNVYKSFQEFYSSEEYKKVEKDYQQVEKFANELVILSDNVDIIKKYAQEEFYGDLFSGNEQVIVHENIPSDGNDGALKDIEEAKIINIRFDKIQFVNGVFYIPVEFNAIFRIEYFLFKADYDLLRKYRDISIIDHDWDDPYYLVEESFNVQVSFKCSIEQDSLKDGAFKFSYEPASILKFEIINNKNYLI